MATSSRSGKRPFFAVKGPFGEIAKRAFSLAILRFPQRTDSSVEVIRGVSLYCSDQINKMELPKRTPVKEQLMSTATMIPAIEQIGDTAGLVWQCLDLQESISMSQLIKSIDAPRDVIMQAVGWLARSVLACGTITHNVFLTGRVFVQRQMPIRHFQ
jgi:hypothetical protein